MRPTKRVDRDCKDDHQLELVFRGQVLVQLGNRANYLIAPKWLQVESCGR